MYFNVGQDAYDYEQNILAKFAQYKVPIDIAKQVLPISGHTELFDRDILNADAELLDLVQSASLAKINQC